MSRLALVTGGGGFLGRAVVDGLLERGERVRVFSRRTFPDLEARGVECVAGDIGAAGAVRAACEGADVVFHVAALAAPWGKAQAFERTNVAGTRNVIDACRGAGIAKLVYTSSPSVVAAPDLGTHHAGVDESVPYPTEWIAHYPRTKAAAEQAVLAANDAALATCALRPHLILGPGDPHLLPRLFARARAGRLRQVGEGTNKVDMTFVDDAARAHLLADERLAPGAACAGKAYFITQGEPVVLWDWLRELLVAVGLPPVGRSVPARRALRMAGAFEAVWRLLRLGGEPPLTRYVVTQMATDHYFDITAARRDLGYEPSRTMDEVTGLLVEHYRGAGERVLFG